MKKILGVFSTLIMVLLMSNPVMAKTSYQYYLDGPDMIANLDENYIVFWTGMDEDDKTLEYIGASYDEVMKSLEENGSSLYAFDENGEIYISIEKTDGAYEFSSYSDEDLKQFATEVGKGYEDEYGIELNEAGVIKSSTQKYVKVSLEAPKEKDHIALYITSYEDWLIRVQYYVYGRDLNSNELPFVEKNIVDFEYGKSKPQKQGRDFETISENQQGQSGQDGQESQDDWDDGPGVKMPSTASNGGESNSGPVPIIAISEMALPEPKSYSGMLIFSLVITFLVYAIPIMLYRYVIKEEPCQKKKGVGIALVYGVIALLISAGVIFIADVTPFILAIILVWGLVNYKILTSGYDKIAPKANISPQAIPISSDGQATVMLPQQVPPIQPAQQVQSIQPAQPIQPVRPVQPMQPVQSVRSVQPVQPVQPVQSVRPVQSVQPVQQVQVVQQAQNVSTSKPATKGPDEKSIWEAANAGMDDLDDLDNFGAAPVSKSYKFCPKCGEAIVEGAKFCGKCGHNLS